MHTNINYYKTLLKGMNTPKSVLLFRSSIDKDSVLQGCCGISISTNWILTHGTILSPIINESYAILNFITNMEPGELTTVPRELTSELKYRVFCDVEIDDNRSCPRSNSFKEHHGAIVFAWRCSLLKKTFDEFFKTWNFSKSSELSQIIDRSLRSVFLLIRIYDSDESIVETSLGQALSCVLDQAPRNLIRGSSVIIESSPHGNPVFAGSIAHGVLSNIIGDEGCVIMTDAHVFPSSEGSPVYTIPPDCTYGTLSGMVIASSSWCRGEWVDYIFAANLAPCVLNILRKGPPPIVHHENKDAALDRGVVLVRCGINWGTGVFVDEDSGTFLTCSHVVAEAPEREISIVMRPDKPNSRVEAKLLYKTPENQPYDVAVLRVDPQIVDSSLRSVRLSRATILKGEPVVSVGFPFSSSIRPTISAGVVSKSMDCVLLTTCCVQSGTSGGPIVSRVTGEMLGMIVCNMLSSDGTVLYPRINLAVPAAMLSGPLREYLRTDNPDVFRAFTCDDAVVRKIWDFYPFLPAKL